MGSTFLGWRQLYNKIWLRVTALPVTGPKSALFMLKGWDYSLGAGWSGCSYVLWLHLLLWVPYFIFLSFCLWGLRLLKDSLESIPSRYFIFHDWNTIFSLQFFFFLFSSYLCKWDAPCCEGRKNKSWTNLDYCILSNLVYRASYRLNGTFQL